MKKILIALISLWSSSVFAQKGIDTTAFPNNLGALAVKLASITNNIDSAFHSDTSGVLDAYVYNKFLEDKFTYLTYNKGTLPTVNSASLDLLNNATQLKLSFAKEITRAGKITSILGAGIISKIGDGISDVFKGNSATSGTTLFINYSSLEQKKKRFKTITDQYMSGKPVQTFFGNTVLKLEKYHTNFKSIYPTDYFDRYKIFLTRLHTIDSLLIAKAEKGICKCASDSDKYKIDLFTEKEKIEDQLAQVGLTNGNVDDFFKSIENKYQQGYYDLLTKYPAWEFYKLHWLDLGTTYNHDSYVTYDSNLGLNKRFGSKDFDSWGFKVTQNFLKEKSQEKGIIQSWYANISYQPVLINSYTNLDPVDIVKNVLAANVGDTSYIFQTSKKAKDISGKPYRTTWQHGISGAYTVMFSAKQVFGLNFLAQSQFSNISKPIFGSRAGVIFSFTNNGYDPGDKKSSTNIHFEIFLQFPDMTDVSNTGKSVWQKKVIGISTNIPFNKIFLK